MAEFGLTLAITNVRFKDFDKDSNRLVSIEDLERFLKGVIETLLDPSRVFTKHIGCLTREQLRSCLVELGLSRDDIEEKINAMDADSESTISMDLLGKLLETETPLQRWASSFLPADLVGDALPIKKHQAPLEELSQLDDDRIRVICECLSRSLERVMKKQVALLKKSLKAQKTVEEGSEKFQVVPMSAGSTEDFYNGLEVRIGESG